MALHAPGRSQNKTCFRKCPLPIDTNIEFLDRNSSSSGNPGDDGTNNCKEVCLAESKICDGIVDLVNPLTNLTSSSYTFLPFLPPPPPSNKTTITMPLLFPDELYCLDRSLPIFSINYLVTGICFFLCAAFLWSTCGLLPFLWRRSQRKVKKDRARIAEQQESGGPYGSLGES